MPERTSHGATPEEYVKYHKDGTVWALDAVLKEVGGAGVDRIETGRVP